MDASLSIRAVGYYRVSTERQSRDDRNSLPVQQDRFIAWCHDHGAEPHHEYVDTVSGTRTSRVEYQRMLADARKGEFTTVVVRHLDRFGRDQWEIMARIAELKSIGVEVAATDESLDHFIVVAAKAFAADHEAKRLGERIRSARIRQAEAGKATGRPPYGYRLGPTNALVIEPTEAAIVRRVFAMLLDENMGARAIAIRLNGEGIPSPSGKMWSPEGTRKMLRRETYAGTLTFAEIATPDAHAAIIDRATWERAQERLARMSTLPGGRTQRSTWLLSGLARCSYCEGPMHGTKTRQGKRRYQCGRMMRDAACSGWNRHDADELERLVLDLVAEGGSPVVEEVEDDTEQWAHEADRIRQTVTQLDAELTANLDLYRQDALTLEQLRIANQVTQQRREAAVMAVTAAEAAYARAVSRRERLDRSALAQLRTSIATLPPLQAKAALQGIVECIVVSEDGVEVTLL